jgi:hypothetical protein
MKKASSLINKFGTYSTTKDGKFISMQIFKNGKEASKYIPKTKENLKALAKLKGKAEVYDDKRFGKRFIWW